MTKESEAWSLFLRI